MPPSDTIGAEESDAAPRPETYEWATLRVVPSIERGEFVNVGVLLYCKVHEFLAAAIALDEERAGGLDAHLDLAAVRRHLEAIRQIAEGAPAAGANGARPHSERFRWLTAPRSTVLQPSPVHLGLTVDPAGELARLAQRILGRPQARSTDRGEPDRRRRR